MAVKRNFHIALLFVACNGGCHVTEGPAVPMAVLPAENAWKAVNSVLSI